MSEIQNVEKQPKQFESRNSVVPAPVSVEVQAQAAEPEVAQEPVMMAESPEPVSDSSKEEGELPDHFKRRLGKEQKKHERELARIRAELEQERARNSQQNVPHGSLQQQQQNGYVDPLGSGEFIDLTTEKGREVYEYHQKLHQKLENEQRLQEERNQREIENRIKEHMQDSRDAARERHADYDQVIYSAGINDNTARELGNLPDPAGLAYYIGSNPREVERLQRLPAYELRRELARHYGDMVSKRNITRAPAPITPVGTTGLKASRPSLHKTLAEMKAERRAKSR